MDTSTSGNRRLGKALPQHKLMQNLLGDFYSDARATKSTQTCEIATTDRVVGTPEWLVRRPTSSVDCCCKDPCKEPVRMVKRGRSRHSHHTHETRDIIDLIGSLREKILKQEEVTCCCCGDGASEAGWSDVATERSPEDVVQFPRETRQAVMSMLANDTTHTISKQAPVLKKPQQHRHHRQQIGLNMGLNNSYKGLHNAPPPPPPRYELLSPLQDIKKHEMAINSNTKRMNISQEILAQIRLSKNKLEVR